MPEQSPDITNTGMCPHGNFPSGCPACSAERPSMEMMCNKSRQITTQK